MTSISTSAFSHFTWQIGHYTLHQVVIDDFNTMQNSLLYIKDAGSMSLKLCPSGGPTGKNCCQQIR